MVTKSAKGALWQGGKSRQSISVGFHMRIDMVDDALIGTDPVFFGACHGPPPLSPQKQKDKTNQFHCPLHWPPFGIHMIPHEQPIACFRSRPSSMARSFLSRMPRQKEHRLIVMLFGYPTKTLSLWLQSHPWHLPAGWAAFCCSKK
ncbi:hypothetical protein BC940DRAFT_295982 [Gongronella butleri]|nr:hypothetical protein BC940DRAFT_295982 [Gongronella butleri]